MARVMLSAGMFASRAARTAERSRALCSGYPPPMRAATVTSRINLVKSAPLVAPIASFLRLIFVHLLWPDITGSQGKSGSAPSSFHGPVPGVPPTGPQLHLASAPGGADSSRCRLAPSGQLGGAPG